MEKIREEVTEIKECMIRMEADVAHHIKRTDALQKMTEPMWKIFVTLKYGSVLVVGLSAVIAAIAKLRGYF